ncbi:peptidoglycan bridge formation glycyltransferase FemA/FemB family protein [Meiothermus sp. QL-1]|uniref:lipid II:glycine glycyltransferase FemX n=1 Tax=Meiothermus sp. QL-1 TaxID=2058095 RepID=UPI000E0C9BF9|nr:peptidoglycan bridge formation glycyltransferase FemA/FemB family protein [Meiothermus sp. QL-1]RDI95793.1 peptidoglycan bridge formation glycyltransferase FemA/FemB family protein [Meiothermus sp. QL-1]
MLRIEPVDRAEEWNALVASLPITSALQSWGWGEVKRLSGWEPLRLALHDGSGLLAAVQLFRRRLAGPLGLLYAPRGPALRSLEALPQVAEALRRRVGGAVYLKLEPETGQPAGEPPPVFSGLRPAESIQPEYSIWLDLSLGREGILAQMESMHRRNTRLAEKRVVCSIEGEEAFEEFWRLFEETNRRARLLQHAKAYYQAVLREMNQPLGRAFISVARLEGRALAAGLFVAFAGRVDYLYGGSSRENTHAKAPNGMHWRAILWGLEHGYRVYDLWGVPRVREGSHAAGIDAFKEGFGGQRVRFPAYDLPLSPLYGPLTRALRLRKSWVNYRTRGTFRDVL